MPYGTVNLRYGVPVGETTVTCTAGIGTFVVEFGTLTKLTGDPLYEEVRFFGISKTTHFKYLYRFFLQQIYWKFKI